MPTIVELPSPSWVELVADLVRERARARDEADGALGEDLGRDDPDVRLAGREHAGAVGADHRHPARPGSTLELEHVVRRECSVMQITVSMPASTAS